VLLLRVRARPDGTLEVLSPGVGLWSGHPHAGALVGPGSVVGTLEVQNRKVDLVLPDRAAGRVDGTMPADRTVAVEYGGVLFAVAPVSPDETAGVSVDAGRLGHPEGAGLPEGARAVVAPTDGVFYARPSPEAPPFVEIGSEIRAGQSIGLIEVMKTFNPISFGGPGFPEKAKVIEIRAQDSAEVEAGDILIVVR
jgi:acetyl-CoA carboxylase biotin carboxyl carrier protein